MVLRTPFDDRTFSVMGSPLDASTARMIDQRGGVYEPAVMTVLSDLLPDDAVTLDVGANIGALSLVLSHLTPRGWVHALEPAAGNFAYLEENLARNHASNVTAERLALYDSAGNTVIHFSERFAGGAFLSDIVREGNQEQVTTARLDDWVEQRGITRLDLVKLDVEGAEARTLRGAMGAIKSLRPHLVIEFNPIVVRRFQGQPPESLYRLLTELFPRVFALEEDGSVSSLLSWGHLRALLHRRAVIDLLCTFAEGSSAGRLRLPPRRASLPAFLRARLGLNPLRPPRSSFIPEPACRVEVAAPEVPLHSNEGNTLTVTVRNTSRSWYSGAFEPYPVFLSYRWLDPDGNVAAEGRPTPLPPLRPNASTTTSLEVQAPGAAGAYLLVVSLVQRDVMWFFEVDPSMGWSVPVDVKPAR